jgi:hypothetical protein
MTVLSKREGGVVKTRVRWEVRRAGREGLNNVEECDGTGLYSPLTR